MPVLLAPYLHVAYVVGACFSVLAVEWQRLDLLVHEPHPRGCRHHLSEQEDSDQRSVAVNEPWHGSSVGAVRGESGQEEAVLDQ